MALKIRSTRLSSASLSKESTLTILLRYLGLAVVNAIALITIYAFLHDDNIALALVFTVITVIANVIILVPGLRPVRWIAPGLLLAILFVIYPLVYTVWTGFTNYGDGHMLTKDQLVDLVSRQQYVASDAQTYSWSIYQNDAGEYAIWLSGMDEDNNNVAAFAVIGEPIEDIESPPDVLPETYRGYRLLTTAETSRALGALQDAIFGTDDDTAAIANRRQAARPLQQRYIYDREADTLLDRQTEILYYADESVGLFVPEGGSLEDALVPGYRVTIGLENFQRLFRNQSLLGPLVDVFTWTVTYAVLAVVLSFAFGLMMAIILDHPLVPMQKFWRSLIFIPYAIPAVISIMIWRGLLNQNVGLITTTIADFTGIQIYWFTDPWMAKVAILLVDMWLGYPYMMLVCSGALKGIPSELYEAAAVDGAKGWKSFWNITLPMLLIAVGPLLIASFTFTFNNYLLVELLTEGNPPMAGTTTPAGATDILITYTYQLAFPGAGTHSADYGYASAITLVIFIVMAVIALFNFRLVGRWERTSDNV